MENNLPIISKRVLNMVRVAFFILRKEISKSKLIMNFNMILKRRSKLAGKAIANLMSHHHNHGGSTISRHSHHQFTSSREYEFSCSDTPNHFFSIGKRHRIHNHNHNHNHMHNAQAPSTHDDEVATMNTMKAVLEMFNNEAIVEAYPTLPELGRSPIMRKLRVTDSPFPLRDDDEKDNQVDKAAEDFIKRFYSQLRQQN